MVEVSVTLRFTQPDTVDDTRMVQLIRNNCILFPEKGFKESGVCIETGRVKYDIIHFYKRGERALQFSVLLLGPANEADGREAVSIGIQCLFRRFDHCRVICHAEIIIRAKVDYSLSIHNDFSALGGLYFPLGFPEPFTSDVFGRFFDYLFERCIHRFQNFNTVFGCARRCSSNVWVVASAKGSSVPEPPFSKPFQRFSWIPFDLSSRSCFVISHVLKICLPMMECIVTPRTISLSNILILISPILMPKSITSPPLRTVCIAVL